MNEWMSDADNKEKKKEESQDQHGDQKCTTIFIRRINVFTVVVVFADVILLELVAYKRQKKKTRKKSKHSQVQQILNKERRKLKMQQPKMKWKKKLIMIEYETNKIKTTINALTKWFYETTDVI